MLFTAVIVLALIGGVIIETAYHSSSAPRYIAQLGTGNSNGSLSHAYQSANNLLNGESAFSNAPLALFWAMVGIGVYALVSSLMTLIRSVNEVEEEAHYVNLQKDKFIRDTLIHLFSRLLAVLGLWLAAFLIVKYLLPYVLAAAHLAGIGHSWQNAILAAIALWLGLHIVVILARLVTLRTRIFS